MSLYFLGDVHGDPIMSLSYKKNPELKKLTSNDTIIQLGDFGVPFLTMKLNLVMLTMCFHGLILNHIILL